MKITFQSNEDVINFAIDQEHESSIFYELLASKAKEEWLKKIFLSIAKEEMVHKAKLEDLLLKKKGGLIFSGHIDYLGISDKFKDIDPFTMDEIGYKDALIIAMKNEEAALKLYLDLAKIASTKDIQNMFLALAEEEGKHKIYFETEYAENKASGFIN